MTNQKAKTGPVNCQGCHATAAQQTIERVKDIPRMQRNQPDVALIASWTRARGLSDNANITQMDAVPFNHINHEANVASCKACHHASLGKCSECHTSTGTEKGRFVTIEQAMHKRDSNISCIGCHAETQSEPNCAGCHTLIGKRPIPEYTCNTCHAVDKTKLKPSQLNQDAMRAMAKQAIDARPSTFAMVPQDKIPEIVTIKSIKSAVDKFAPAPMPHRKIINTLASQIKDNRMATLFHGEGTTLCMGCHHNSPATTQPPKCVACHGEAYRAKHNDGRPGLLGAFHGQCIACHQAMQIDKPAATDCTACHKKRTS
jgi:hypothetical protein